MVHRPADSRLLSNLLQQEKDYLKHFNQLLNSSAASLDSFTAYAAASPPPASQVILAVAGLLAAADEALKRYAFGIEQWRDAMRLLKDMEDDVGNIMRDREILVTRLIKVSKSHKSTSGTFRDSLLLGHHQQFPSSSSSLSIGDHDSPSPSRPVSVSFTTSTKLAAAQSELQACETHLASKESELALKRCAAVREGLSIRAKAMIDCSWSWGELGRQILHSLDGLGNVEVRGNEHESSIPRDQRSHVPEANSARPSSDFSSIGPSQSASQINCDGHQLPESMVTAPTNTNSRMLGRPINGNTVLGPGAKRIPVSADPTLPRPNSTASTAPSSLSHTQATPTTYKLETVTYAPAIALVVPGKDELSSSPPPPIRGFGSNSSLPLGPPLANPLNPSLAAALTPYAPVMEESSKDQGLQIRMRVPAAHAINEYDIPTAEVAGSEAGTGTLTAWRHSRGASQEGSNQIGYSTPRPQLYPQPLRMPEPILGFDSNAMCSNMPTLNSTISPQRHSLDRRITEEELQVDDSPAIDLSRGGNGGGQAAGTSRAATSALVEVFDDLENGNNQEEDDDELPIEVEDQMIQQGRLAVIENPRFMSEERKRELERERERARAGVASVKEGQGQESKPQAVKEKTRFPFLHQHQKRADTQGQSPSQSDIGHIPLAPASIPASAASVTPKTSPLKTGDLSYISPSKASPSKRFLGSLRGLFGVRQPVSQDSSPSPSMFGTRKQGSSPSRLRARSPSRIRTMDDDSDVDADEDSDVDSPTKTGRGLQALFRGDSAKKKSGSTGGTGWSTRTDRNIRKLTRTGGLGDDDHDGFVSQNVGGNGKGIAGNAVVKAGLVGPDGTGPSGTRKRSASDIGIGAPVVGGSNSPKVSTGGGKRLKKTVPPPSAAASASALYTSRASQRNDTISVAVHPHTSIPSTQIGQSSMSMNTKPATQGKRSASVDDGPRRMNGVQRGEVGQTPVGGGVGKGTIVNLGNRRQRAASDNAGPPLSGNGSAIITTNVPVGTPTRGIPTADTSAVSKGYSSDTAATAMSASPSMKKSVVKNGGPGPAAASAPAATTTPTAATATPSKPTPTRKTSIGASRQPHVQPQPQHQHPTSHSSGGGAIVLAAGGTHPSGTLVSHPGWDTQALPTAGGGLSRNNSLLSAVSAPSGGSGGGGGMSKTKKQKETVLGHGMGSGTSLGRRSSLGSSSGHAEAGAGPDGKGEKKKATIVAPGGSVVQPTQPAPSLMSIVEDVARHNREWSQESSQLLRNKNKLAGVLEKEKLGSVGMVDVVKAPPRIGRDELAQLDPSTIRDRVMEMSTMNVAPGAVTSASGSSSSGPRMVDIKALGSVFDQQNTKIVGSEPAMPKRMQRQASNSTPDLTESQQTHHANLTRRASVTTPTTTIPPIASSSKRPAKSPLRSALKGHSRTPSPSPLPGPFLVPHLQKQQQQQQQTSQEGSRHSAKSNTIVAPVPVSSIPLSTILGPSQPKAPADIRPTINNDKRASHDSTSQRRKDKVRNIAVSEEVVGGSGDAGDSASTDDTGDEVFYTDDDEGHQSEAPIVSSTDNRAMHRASPMLNGHAVGYTYLGQAVGSSSEHSHSTTSTAVARRPPPATISSASQPTTPPQRRKSVRVSLQPTFSPSPPAIEYDDEEEQKYQAPWAWQQDHHSGGGGQHVHAPVPRAAPSSLLISGHQQKVVGPEQIAHNIWEDSSDEDVEYQKAKRLLKRAAKKEEDMNVYVAGNRL